MRGQHAEIDTVTDKHPSAWCEARAPPACACVLLVAVWRLYLTITVCFLRVPVWLPVV